MNMVVDKKQHINLKMVSGVVVKIFPNARQSKKKNTDYRKTKIREHHHLFGKHRSDETKKKIRESKIGKKNKKAIKLKDNKIKLCSWCNKTANYYFSITGKYCCCDHFSKCPEARKRKSQRMIGHEIKELTKRKISRKIIIINKENEKYRRNQSLSRKKSADEYKKDYPFFSKIEEIRDNPDKPGEKEIQVHCKNHNCKNSKEQGGWFTPTYIQLFERIRQVENGQGGCYFYCSEKCKQECPLFNLHSDPFRKIETPYTHEEYNTWKKVVLEQDNYECQKCGSRENLHCHHIIPVKLEPLFVLDPDNGIVLCENCHYKYGHKTGTECSTGNLAKTQCHKI